MCAGAFAAYWDVAQIFALVYVSILVPFRACMDIAVPVDSFAFWLEVIVDIYFIADLVKHTPTHTSFFEP